MGDTRYTSYFTFQTLSFIMLHDTRHSSHVTRHTFVAVLTAGCSLVRSCCMRLWDTVMRCPSLRLMILGCCHFCCWRFCFADGARCDGYSYDCYLHADAAVTKTIVFDFDYCRTTYLFFDAALEPTLSKYAAAAASAVLQSYDLSVVRRTF